MLLDKVEQVWAFYLTFNSRAIKENRPRLESQPCSPAPGRRILIIRSDNQQASPSSPFISFDRLGSPASTLSGGGYQNHGILKLDPTGFSPESHSPPKRKWNLLKTVFGGTTNPKPGEVTPPGSVSDENEINPIDSLMGEAAMATATGSDAQDSGDQTAEDCESIYETKAPHQPYNFKFSLEWHNWSKSTKERTLSSPSLPRKTLNYIQRQRSAKGLKGSATVTAEEFVEDPNTGDARYARDADASTTSTRNSYATTKTSDDDTDSAIMAAMDDAKLLRNERLVASKYAGRALAEWTLVVSEFDNFFERRRKEGVPTDELVETPTLSVENFRK